MHLWFVIGLIFGLIRADVINTPVNNSIVFLQEKDVMFTNDVWKIVINVDLASYEDVIAELYQELVHAQEFNDTYTSARELQQVKVILMLLEERLNGVKTMLPRVDARRGLIDLGGSLLKALFGTATVTDLNTLHDTVRALDENEENVIHVVNQHVTYIKQLDESVELNAKAITNLSKWTKDAILNLNDGWTKLVLGLDGLYNMTNNIREVTMVTRQLEFALMQLEMSVNEIVQAMECVRMGKVPIGLVSPNKLQELLKNVTLKLPNDLELFAGIQFNNMYLYYEMMEAAVLADVHSFKLVLSVPLKSMGRDFTMYRMFVFPLLVMQRKYVQLELKHQFLAINLLHRQYLLLTDQDITQCRGDKVFMCPTNQAVYDMQLMTCELALFLQSPEVQRICQRNIVIYPVLPRMIRHGAVRVYYFPQQQEVHFKCSIKGGWHTFSLKLSGGGILSNVSSCYISTDKLQFYPELRGELDSVLPAPALYVPELQPVVSAHELHTLQQLMPVDTKILDQMEARLSEYHHGSDVNSLMQLHAVSLEHERRTNWLFYALISLGTILMSFLSYFCFLPYLRSMVTRCRRNPNEFTHPDAKSEHPQTILSTSQGQVSPKPECSLNESAATPVRFSTYSLQNE
jgi:hypothetical protein